MPAIPNPLSLPCLNVIFNLIAQAGYFARQGVSVNLGQIFTLSVDVGGLQRLPSAFHGVIGQVARYQMGMKLRIQFAAGVMILTRDHHVRRVAFFVRAIPANRAPARRSISAAISPTAVLCASISRGSSSACTDTAFGAETVKSYRLRAGRCLFDRLAVHFSLVNAIRAVPLAQKFAGLRIIPQADGVKRPPW